MFRNNKKQSAKSVISDIRYLNAMIDTEASKIEREFRAQLNNSDTGENAIDVLVAQTSKHLARLAARIQIVETVLTADLGRQSAVSDEITKTISIQSTNSQGKLAIVEDNAFVENKAPALPAQVYISAEQFKSSSNMFAPETTQTGLTYCWSGKNPRLSFTGLVTREQASQVKVRVVGAITPELKQQAQLLVDGVVVKHRVEFDGALDCFIATMPAVSGKADETRLDIVLPAVYSPKELGQSADERKLGLAINLVEFAPLPEKPKRSFFKRN